MRTFKQHLKEFWGAGEVSSGQLQAGHLSMAVEDPVVIDAINAYIGQIAESDYVNPYTVINKVWHRLGQLGLSFNLNDVHFNTQESKTGSYDLPMSRWGGRQGKDIDTPHTEKLDDDGISHVKEGGMKLHIEYAYNDENDRWHITGKLV